MRLFGGCPTPALMMGDRAFVLESHFNGVNVFEHNWSRFAGGNADYVPSLTLRALHECVLYHVRFPFRVVCRHPQSAGMPLSSRYQ
jgi:hypothetical protein